MGRKGKQNKHTAKELEAKAKAAKMKNGGAGGGKSGVSNRKQAGAKASIKCLICLVMYMCTYFANSDLFEIYL